VAQLGVKSAIMTFLTDVELQELIHSLSATDDWVHVDEDCASPYPLPPARTPDP